MKKYVFIIDDFEYFSKRWKDEGRSKYQIDKAFNMLGSPVKGKVEVFTTRQNIKDVKFYNELGKEIAVPKQGYMADICRQCKKYITGRVKIPLGVISIRVA